MKCPMCGNDLRQSETDPHWGLCDSCKVKFEWKEDSDDYADIATNFSMSANDYAIETEDGYGYQELEAPVKRKRRKKHTGVKIVFTCLAILCVLAFGAFAFLVGLTGGIGEAMATIKDGLPFMQPQVTQSDKNSYTIDGITITANYFSIEPYDDSERKYTKKITVDFTIKNDSSKAFGYISAMDGRLPDGYELEKNILDMSDLDLKQVASGKEITAHAYFLTDDSISPDKIICTYNFMDYNKEYWQDLGKIMTGEMSQEDYSKKYGKYKVLEFELLKK